MFIFAKVIILSDKCKSNIENFSIVLSFHTLFYFRNPLILQFTVYNVDNLHTRKMGKKILTHSTNPKPILIRRKTKLQCKCNLLSNQKEDNKLKSSIMC